MFRLNLAWDVQKAHIGCDGQVSKNMWPYHVSKIKIYITVFSHNTNYS